MNASDLKQRVRDAMDGADRKTAHLNPRSEEYVKVWMKAFHDVLWGITHPSSPDDVGPYLTRNSASHR